MSVFPGDMSIGWGFGIEGELPRVAAQESQPTDPLLAVSELEQRVEMLEGMLKTYFAEAPSKRIFSLEQRITDLEERLRSLVLVVNTLVIKIETKE